MGRGRGAKVVRVELDRGLKPVEVEPGYRSVLLLVRLGVAFIGQVWLQPRAVLSPQTQWQAIVARLGPVLGEALLRGRLAKSLAPETSQGAIEPLSVSVIVCTRDRAEQLSACLNSLERLEPAPAEVVVVDNAPGDESTRELCERYPVRYLREPVPGQARARNRGIAESEGDLVAFTDDDCIVDRRWLDRLDRDFDDPLTMLVTGYVGPLTLETESQRWFEAHGGFERHPFRRVLDLDAITPLRGAAVAGAGANMIFRRSGLEQIAGFAEDLGPGTPARSGDDKYAFYRTLRAGFRIVQEPGRIVWHRHRSERRALRRIMSDHLTSDFAYTTRCLLEDGETDALHLWRWWAKHFLGDVRRYLQGAHSAVPLWVTAAEIKGALSGPLRLRRSIASRRRIEPIAPVNGAEPARRTALGVGSEPPRLAVTIASRQRRDSLARALRALARQDYPTEEVELIVVLDGSTDGSAEMATALELPYRLRTIQLEPSGLATARDVGARAAAPDSVVVFLDDDIDADPGFLAAHAAAHADADALAGLGRYPPASSTDPSLWELRQQRWWEDHFRRKADPGHRWSYVDLVDGNLSLRRSTLLDVGGYDRRFRGGRRQDWELGMRLLQAGVRFEFIPDASGTHRLETTLEAGLAHAREEGRWDVLLATKHPQTKGHLPLRLLGERLERGRRRSALVRHPLVLGLPPEPLVSAAAHLERVHFRPRWSQVVDRMLLHSYARGVRDALPGAAAIRAFLDPAEIRRTTLRVELDLLEPASLEIPPGAGAVDVAVEAAGAPIATVPATEPGGQWDWRHLSDRVVAEAGRGPSVGLGRARLASDAGLSVAAGCRRSPGSEGAPTTPRPSSPPA